MTSDGRRRFRIPAARTLQVAAWVMVALAWTRLAVVAKDQLTVSRDLAYETPVVASIDLIRDGKNPYSSDAWGRLPYVLTLYTPLYHQLTAVLPADPENPFFTGRAVALASMLAAAAALFALARRGGSWLAPALASACFVLLWPVTSNAAFVKNDPLALALGAWAVVLLARGPARTGILLGAAVLCGLSLSAKQSYLAAPLACMAHLWLADRRRARLFSLCLAGVLAALALLATVAWGQGFWFCTFVAPSNPLRLEQAVETFSHLLRQPFALLLVGGWLALLVSLARRRMALLKESPGAAWALCSLLTLLITVGKSGSSTNYCFESALALGLWGASLARGRAPGWMLEGRRVLLPALLVLGGLLELFLAAPESYSFTDPVREPIQMVFRRHTSAQLAELAPPGAVVLDLFSPLTNYDVQDRPVFNDPLLYALLWDEGVLDPEPFLDSLRQHEFDVVLLPRGLQGELLPDGALADAARAVQRHYRLADRDPAHDYYTP